MRTLWLAGALLVCSTLLAQGSFYRLADGTWKPLKATATGPITKFSLAPEDIGGGSTLIVVNKPTWMVLDDKTPPALVKVLLDGQERQPEELDLGAVAVAPTELAFAVKDDKNPLDAAGVEVTLDGQPVPAAQVTITKLDAKSLRIAIKPGKISEARHLLVARVSDLAPERNTTTLTLKFSTAPMITNGSFEQVDNEGNPVGWSPGAWSSDAATQYEAGVAAGGVDGQKAWRFKGTAGSLNLVCAGDLGQLKPEVAYVLTGQYKSENGAAVSAISYDATGKQLDYLTQPLAAAKDWTAFTWEFQLKPHEKATLVPRTSGKGETWFDALKLSVK